MSVTILNYDLLMWCSKIPWSSSSASLDLIKCSSASFGRCLPSVCLIKTTLTSTGLCKIRLLCFTLSRDMRTMEILKLRFGEEALDACAIMLKDVADSRRYNTSFVPVLLYLLLPCLMSSRGCSLFIQSLLIILLVSSCYHGCSGQICKTRPLQCPRLEFNCCTGFNLIGFQSLFRRLCR